MTEKMAALDVSKLKVGTVFYGVKESNNAFHRKKIHRVINGEDWFKYEMPLTTYEVVTYNVLGVLTKHLEGEWEPHSDYEFLTEIYVSSSADSSTQKYTMYVDDMDSDKYFLDKSSALVYSKDMNKKSKELDKK
jgi:hypothetical protein